MKRVFCLVLMLGFTVMLSAAEFRIIPHPKKVVTGSELVLPGRSFGIDNRIPGFDPVEMVTDQLAEYCMPVDADARLKIRFIMDEADVQLKKHPEAYRLKIDKNGVELRAAAVPGAWRGTGRMLAILCGPDTVVTENSITLPEMEIFDYPNIADRAMKIEFPNISGKALKEQTLPVIRSVAMFGFNMIFFDLRGNFECRKHPELTQQPVLLQKDLAEFIRYARACGLEVLPLTNSIGHLGRAPLIFPLYGKSSMEWSRPGKKAPVAMDLTHPEFYKVLFDYFDEVLDLFGSPRYFNIGCDEFHDGTKILKEKTGKDFPVFFSEYINKVSAYFAKRKCQPLFWQDMFFPRQKPWYVNGPANGPANALDTLDLISKDTNIVMWKYNFDEEYPHLTTLLGKGFKNTWAAPWFDPEATAALSKRCHELGVKLLGTTWWYYPQMQGIPTVGEFAWNAANPVVRANSYYDKLIDHYYFSGKKSVKNIKTVPAKISGGTAIPDEAAAEYRKVSGLFSSPQMFKAPELLMKKIPQPWDWQDIVKAGHLGITFGTSPLIQSRPVIKMNVPRESKSLVIYTPEYGKSTRTNEFGVEFAVSGDTITAVSGRAMDRPMLEKGNMPIPHDGVVLSFHGAVKPVSGRLTRNLYIRPGMKIGLYKLPDPAIKKSGAKILVCRFSGRKPNVRVYVSTLMPVHQRVNLATFRVDAAKKRGKSVTFTSNRLLSGDAPLSGEFTFHAVKGVSDAVNPVICIEYRAKDKTGYPARMVFSALREGAVSGFTVLGAEEFD